MFRDPPHYLKPLTSTSTPKRLLWLACRGHSSRKRDHFEQHFDAAALGRTYWTARTKTRRDTLDTFDDPATLWRAVAEWCPVGRRVVLFTYDLAEQMRLAAMLSHLPAMGWTLDKIVLERNAAWCLLRNGKRSLMCCDLRSWCPVSFAKIAVDVNRGAYVPQEHPAGSSFADDTAAYKAVVIRDATLQILNWIEGENLGQFRPTGSGQSFTAYRRRFLHTPLLVHDDMARLVAERQAMHTGRAEAWRVGSLRASPYVEYDLHAAYATIGRDCEVPIRARGELRKPSIARALKATDSYAVLADITVDTNVECLPYRVNDRTMWPVGKFRTCVWDAELSLALDYCNSVTVNHAWLYQRGPALRDFCTYVLDGLDGQTQVYGLVPQRVLKHWSRCLVGRLGLRYRAWHRFGPQVPPDVRLVTYLDLDEGTSTDMLLAGSQRLLLGDLTEARESLPQVPGWIMSKCRAVLWEAMCSAGKQLVYVDTDSVIFQAPPNQPPSFEASHGAAKLTWTRKGSYPSMTIYGPRCLDVGADRRFAGIPLSAERTKTLEFDGEVMRSVKASMRNGELDCVVSMPRTFHVVPQDLRRQHNPDGSTSPYRLEEACS